MHTNKYINFMLQLLFMAVVAALCYVGFKYVLKALVPLIIAYLISCIIIRPVNFLGGKGFPRKIAAILFTLMTITLLGLLIYWLVSTLIYEGSQLVDALPGMVESLLAKLENVQEVIDQLFTMLPGPIRDMPFFSLEAWLKSLSLPNINVGGALSSAAGVASSVPGFLLSLIFVFVATYFLTSDRKEIMAFSRRQISDRVYETILELKDYFYTSVFSWLKAQAILICITFVILCIWFLILRQPYALLLAILIALIDALPILGVGTVMIPWAMVDLLSGDFRHALFMILVYASVLIVRNSLEPKIMSTQLGLHPFVTLMCVYFGFRLAGFAGMFLLPVAVICLIKLQETGRIKLWK